VKVAAVAVAVGHDEPLGRGGEIMLQIDPNFAFPPPPYIVAGTPPVWWRDRPGHDAGLSVGEPRGGNGNPMTMRGASMEYLVVPVGSVVAAPSNADDEAACTLR